MYTRPPTCWQPHVPSDCNMTQDDKMMFVRACRGSKRSPINTYPLPLPLFFPQPSQVCQESRFNHPLTLVHPPFSSSWQNRQLLNPLLTVLPRRRFKKNRSKSPQASRSVSLSSATPNSTLSHPLSSRFSSLFLILFFSRFSLGTLLIP